MKIKEQNTKREIENAILEMDPKLERGSDLFMAVGTLLASARIGPDPIQIAKQMQYPADTVARFGKNLTRSRIWRNGKVHADWSGENGGMEFWVHVCVAQGLVKVVNR